MASALYNPYKKLILDADLDMLVDDLKVVLVDAADYTFSAAHDFLDDIAVGGRVATSANMSSKSTTDGVFDAADVVLSTVSGDQSEALVIYKDTGVASTSPLIAFIDTATGLPVTPGGGNINIVWDSGANKIFAI